MLGLGRACSNPPLNENSMISYFSSIVEPQSSVIIDSKIFVRDEGKGNVRDNKRQRHRTLCVPSENYYQGFDLVKENNMDHETKELIYSLQARIVGLEKEVVNLKKANHELSTQNKSFKEKMGMVAEEQEKVFKVR